MSAGSLREQHKQDKRDRIREAALTLFRKRGFERTTTREIAARAGIGTGTLFLYARTKEQVLALAFGDEIDRIWDERMATLPAGPLIDRLAHVFDGPLAFFASDRDLARLLVKEISFIGPGGGERPLNTLVGVLNRLASIVTDAQAAGEIGRGAPAMLVAANLFAVFHFHLIGWLNGRFPDDRAFRTFLRAGLELCLNGVGRGEGTA